MMEPFGCHSMSSSRNIIILVSHSTSHTNIISSSCLLARGSTDSRSITKSSNTSTSRPRHIHIVTIHEESAILTIMLFFTSRTRRINLSTSKSTNGCPTKASEPWEGGPKSFLLESTHSPLSTRDTRLKLPTSHCTSTERNKYRRSANCEHVVLLMLNVITTLV